MRTLTAPIDVELWIDDEDLDRLALDLERVIRRPRRLFTRPAFYADYLEVE